MDTLIKVKEKVFPKEYMDAVTKMLLLAAWLSAPTWVICEILTKGMWS